MIPSIKTVFNGVESLPYLDPKVWELLSLDLKQIESLLQIKSKIKLRTALAEFEKNMYKPLDIFKKFVLFFIWKS